MACVRGERDNEGDAFVHECALLWVIQKFMPGDVLDQCKSFVNSTICIATASQELGKHIFEVVKPNALRASSSDTLCNAQRYNTADVWWV